jgi:hypothetical protein
MGNGQASVKREAEARVVEEIAMDRDAFVKDGGDEGRRMRGDIISNDEVGSTKMTMAVDALESDVEKAKGTERGGVILVIFYPSLLSCPHPQLRL